MFDDFIDWVINDCSVPYMLSLMNSADEAEFAYDKFFSDLAEEWDGYSEMETPMSDSFFFEPLWDALEKQVLRDMQKMSPKEVVELQDQWADVFEDVDLSPIQSQLLTGKLLRDLSEKPEKVLIKI